MDANRPNQLKQPELQQGARSIVEAVSIDGKDCIRKTYIDTRHGSAIDKWRNEVAFYNTYGHLDIVPNVLACETDISITLERRPGIRHIEAVQAGLDKVLNNAISFSYGIETANFLELDVIPDPLQTKGLSSHGIQEIGRMGKAALENNPPYRLPYLIASLDHLTEFVHPGDEWDIPMLTKSDWSSANLLVDQAAVTCIYDFDTAHMSTRLGFIGNIINSCLHLSWSEARKGLEARGLSLPSTELQIRSAQASMWLKVIPRDLGKIRWPSPSELQQKLEDLERKCHMG